MTYDEPRGALFVTDLADAIRPATAFAAVRVLEAAECRVEIPLAQACCSQPAFNSGSRTDPAAIARRVITAFDLWVLIVVPS